MANSITIKVQDSNKSYIIQYNRRALLKMEESGLIAKIQGGKSGIDTIYEIAYFGFLMHQPTITHEETDQIIDQIGDLAGFMKDIGELIENCVNAVKNTENVGNIVWEKK